jgi:putative transposase
MLLFEQAYNEEHLHSGINFVTPAQRHQGVDAELLAKREAVYERAKSLNPGRWSGEIRNREVAVAVAVSLNPGKLQEIEFNKQAA